MTKDSALKDHYSICGIDFCEKPCGCIKKDKHGDHKPKGNCRIF
jgi:hypothetical protein